MVRLSPKELKSAINYLAPLGNHQYPTDCGLNTDNLERFILFDIVEDSIVLSDKVRLAIAPLNTISYDTNDKNKYLIPIQSAEKLKNYLNKKSERTHMSISDSYITFTTDKGTLEVPKYKEPEFPDYKELVLNKLEDSYEGEVNTKQLLSSIRHLESDTGLIEFDSGLIRVTDGSNEYTIQSLSDNLPNLKLVLNSSYLEESLSNIRSNFVSIRVTNSCRSPLLIRGEIDIYQAPIVPKKEE